MFKKSLLFILMAVYISTLHAQTVAYVVNDLNNTVSVIDTSTNTVTATIPVGKGPFGVVFSPDGTRAYVTNQGDNTISVIDTASNTVLATITLAANSIPELLAITPDGKSLYVSEFNAGNVEVVSTASNSVVATIPVGLFVSPIAITPDGAHAYVVGEDFFSAIDTATNTVSAGPVFVPVTTLLNPTLGFAVTPDGNAAYLAGGSRNPVFVISTATNTITASVTLASAPIRLAITPDGSRVYLSNFFDGVVSIIDTATNTPESVQIPVSGAFALAITPDSSSVYVVNLLENTVSVISTATNTVVATIPGFNSPFAIAIAHLNAPMATLTIENLVIDNNLHEQGIFTLGSNTGGIDLAHQPVMLTVNNFSLTIPAGSFRQVGGNMHFVFNGTVNGLAVTFNLQAEHGSSTQFDYVVDVHGVNITGPDPASVGLKIGHNSGTTTATF
jgi:YVTN family beta-propeller protein